MDLNAGVKNSLLQHLQILTIIIVCFQHDGAVSIICVVNPFMFIRRRTYLAAYITLFINLRICAGSIFNSIAILSFNTFKFKS